MTEATILVMAIVKTAIESAIFNLILPPLAILFQIIGEVGLI